MNGTILLNLSYLPNGSINYSAGFNSICVCPGLNTDFGYLFILALILFFTYFPEILKKINIQSKIDPIYYSRFICLVSIITLLSFSTKNIPNIIIFLVAFAWLGFLIGSNYARKS